VSRSSPRRLDLVLGHQVDSNAGAAHTLGNSPLQLLLNKGSETPRDDTFKDVVQLLPATDRRGTAWSTQSLALGDVNNDGRLDVVACMGGDALSLPNCTVLLNQGGSNPTFKCVLIPQLTSIDRTPSAGASPFSSVYPMELGDLNGDGRCGSEPRRERPPAIRSVRARLTSVLLSRALQAGHCVQGEPRQEQ
jgi:hypothetical protein